jgi:hypothetical protein
MPRRAAPERPRKSLIWLKLRSALIRRVAGHPDFRHLVRPGFRLGFSEQTLATDSAGTSSAERLDKRSAFTSGSRIAWHPQTHIDEGPQPDVAQVPAPTAGDVADLSLDQRRAHIAGVTALTVIVVSANSSATAK